MQSTTEAQPDQLRWLHCHKIYKKIVANKNVRKKLHSNVALQSNIYMHIIIWILCGSTDNSACNLIIFLSRRKSKLTFVSKYCDKGAMRSSMSPEVIEFWSDL